MVGLGLYQAKWKEEHESASLPGIRWYLHPNLPKKKTIFEYSNQISAA